MSSLSSSSSTVPPSFRWLDQHLGNMVGYLQHLHQQDFSGQKDPIRIVQAAIQKLGDIETVRKAVIASKDGELNAKFGELCESRRELQRIATVFASGVSSGSSPSSTPIPATALTPSFSSAPAALVIATCSNNSSSSSPSSSSASGSSSLSSPSGSSSSSVPLSTLTSSGVRQLPKDSCGIPPHLLRYVRSVQGNVARVEDAVIIFVGDANHDDKDLLDAMRDFIDASIKKGRKGDVLFREGIECLEVSRSP